MTHLRKEFIPGIGDAIVARPQLSDAQQALLAEKALEADSQGNVSPEGRLLGEIVLPLTVSEPHHETGEPVTVLPIGGLPRHTRYDIAHAINTHVSPTVIIDRNFSE